MSGNIRKLITAIGKPYSIYMQNNVKNKLIRYYFGTA